MKGAQILKKLITKSIKLAKKCVEKLSESTE